MFDYRANLLAALGLLTGVVACDNPVQKSDLRVSGAPNVTAVLVRLAPGDTNDGAPEVATYCRKNDEKRPGLIALISPVAQVQVCPEDLSKGAALEGIAETTSGSWLIRIVFDQLLDSSIEELLAINETKTIGTLRNTQPVELKCNGTAIPYDGYYIPNGNNLGWSPGPALVIIPAMDASNAVMPDLIPTGASCVLTLTDFITNKSGTAVSSDAREFTFKTAALKSLAISVDPVMVEKTDDVAPLADTASLVLAFNANISAPFPASDVELFSGPNVGEDPDIAVCNGGGTASTAKTSYNINKGKPVKSQIAIGDSGAEAGKNFISGRTYRMQFRAGATVAAVAGGSATLAIPGATDAVSSVCFFTPTTAP